MFEIENRFNVKQKGMKVVIEEIKERIIAKSETIKRYDKRNEQFRQNRKFVMDQAKLYKDFNGKVIQEKDCTEC